MPPSRKMHRKWFTLWLKARRDLGIAAKKCDRIKETNRGTGPLAVRTCLQASELSNLIRQIDLDLGEVEWEPAKGKGDE